MLSPPTESDVRTILKNRSDTDDFAKDAAIRRQEGKFGSVKYPQMVNDTNMVSQENRQISNGC